MKKSSFIALILLICIINTPTLLGHGGGHGGSHAGGMHGFNHGGYGHRFGHGRGGWGYGDFGVGYGFGYDPYYQAPEVIYVED